MHIYKETDRDVLQGIWFMYRQAGRNGRANVSWNPTGTDRKLLSQPGRTGRSNTGEAIGDPAAVGNILCHEESCPF